MLCIIIIWVLLVTANTIVTAGDLNPHAGDQKHQSLNSVLLTARQRHFRSIDVGQHLRKIGCGLNKKAGIVRPEFARRIVRAEKILNICRGIVSKRFLQKQDINN